jgi:predicted kinase
MRLTIPVPALVLLVGPSGSGKSTFAAAHFLPTEVLSSDSIRAALTDDPSNQEASAEAFHVLSLLANGRLMRRLITVIDATNLGARNRNRFSRVAARYGIPTVAIAFDFSPELYAAHNLRRPDRIVDEAVVADQAERMRTAMADLPAERYAAVHVLRSLAEMDDVTIERGAVT